MAPEETGRLRTWTAGVAVVGGVVLAVARFVKYVQVVDDVDVGFVDALAWWSMLAIGTGLLATGVLGHVRASEHPTHDWLALLVGLLVLVLMPAAPAFGIDLGSMFGP